MATQLSDITDVMLAILREADFTSAYPQTLMELQANAAQKDICEWRVIHPLTWEEAEAWALHFLNTEVFYTNIAPVTLTTALASWDTEIDAVTTDYPATWNLYIGWQVLPYTGVTGTQFTWVTGVTVDLDAGEQVSIAFALPSDYSDILNVIYKNRYQITGVQYDNIFADLKSYKGRNNYDNNDNLQGYGINPFYTIKDAAYLIPFQVNETWAMIKLRYQKEPATMVSTWGSEVDATIDDDTYARMTIAYIAVAMMMFERGEEDRWSAVYNNGIKNVRKMYNYYNNTSFESQSWQQYQIWKGKINI